MGNRDKKYTETLRSALDTLTKQKGIAIKSCTEVAESSYSVVFMDKDYEAIIIGGDEESGYWWQYEEE